MVQRLRSVTRLSEDKNLLVVVIVVSVFIRRKDLFNPYIGLTNSTDIDL